MPVAFSLFFSSFASSVVPLRYCQSSETSFLLCQTSDLMKQSQDFLACGRQEGMDGPEGRFEGPHVMSLSRTCALNA